MQLDKQHPLVDNLGMGVDRLILIGNRYNYGTGINFGFFTGFLPLGGIQKKIQL